MTPEGPSEGIDILPQALRSVRLWASNVNAGVKTRPLTRSDIEIIIAQNAGTISKAIGFLESPDTYRQMPLEPLVFGLIHLSVIQRAVVWRGSWLERQVVEDLPALPLLKTCIEVIEETLLFHELRALKDIVDQKLPELSPYLAGVLI